MEERNIILDIERFYAICVSNGIVSQLIEELKQVYFLPYRRTFHHLGMIWATKSIRKLSTNHAIEL